MQQRVSVEFDSTTADFEADATEYCEVSVDSVNAVLTVTIIDQDDVAPDTTCTPTAVSVLENDESPQGVLLSNCSVNGAAPNFAVKFSMSVDPSWAASKFVMDETS